MSEFKVNNELHVMLIAESCIESEVGYMDLCAKVENGKLIVTATNHDGYEWSVSSDLTEVVKTYKYAEAKHKTNY